MFLFVVEFVQSRFASVTKIQRNNAAFEQKAMTFDMQKKASADTTAQ